MSSDRIWPLRLRSRLSRTFLTKFASFWTRCLSFLFSMRSQIACCQSLRVRYRGVCHSHLCFPSASFLIVGAFSLQILNCTLWTAPACHTAPLEIVRSQVCFICSWLWRSLNIDLVSLYCPPPVGSNYLKPLQGPLSNMLQMLQECSQLELALRVLLNSHGSCLQHITSNMMDMKLSMQVWPASGHINAAELQCVCWADNFSLDSLSALWQTSAEDLYCELERNPEEHQLNFGHRGCGTLEQGQSRSSPVSLSFLFFFCISIFNSYLCISFGCRFLTGGRSIAIWQLDCARCSLKQRFSKYCGRSSTVPGRTITKSW